MHPTPQTARSQVARPNLNQLVEESLETLARATDAQQFNAAIRQRLAAAAHMRHLSSYNQLLVAIQGGTYVRTFRGWLKEDRCVTKGEKSGIFILAPVHFSSKPNKETDTKGVADRFGAVPVFDWSQTHSLVEGGDEMPAYFTAATNGDADAAVQALETATVQLGVALTYGDEQSHPHLRTAHGYNTPGHEIVVDINLPNHQAAHVIAHELAHEVLHRGADRAASTQQQREWQADAAANAIMDYYGIDAADSSVYVALYGAKGHEIRQQLSAVTRAVKTILDATASNEAEEQAA